MAEQELTPEQLVESIKQLRIVDVLVSVFSSVAQLGYAKLEPSTRDLEQARLAIDSLRALLPVLETDAPADTVRDLRQVVTNLQLAYAGAATSATSATAAGGEEGERAAGGEPEPAGEEEAGGDG